MSGLKDYLRKGLFRGLIVLARKDSIEFVFGLMVHMSFAVRAMLLELCC